MKNSVKNMVLETIEGLHKTGAVDEINTTQIYLEKRNHIFNSKYQGIKKLVYTFIKKF